MDHKDKSISVKKIILQAVLAISLALIVVELTDNLANQPGQETSKQSPEPSKPQIQEHQIKDRDSCGEKSASDTLPWEETEFTEGG